ncbi:MAG: hypothetical protein KJO52_14680 [Maribacter sp.]|nr:hypothetical protein [Maribacter sp.]
MRINPEKFNHNLETRNIKNASFIGLDAFINNLEKHFFSEISIREDASDSEKLNLVIELSCDLTLWELIHQYNLENWGTFNTSKFSLSNEISALERINDIRIDVDEFSIVLKDTTLIIDKIYNQSIGEQLEHILHELGIHYVHYTKNYSEVPYEIFVAVFVENLMQAELTSNNSKKNHGYSSFWAIYFESEIDAVIYDVQNSTFLNENLYMKINK